MKERKVEKNLFHLGFEISLLVKAFDGVVEVVSGLLFLLINPSRLNSIVKFLTYHELSQDPKDIFANLLINLSSSFSIDTQLFIVAYLLLHGVIKIFLVILLYKKKIWAYPVSIVFLIVFIGYQIHRYTLDHSIFMILLTVFDLIMIFLIWKEYKAIEEKKQNSV